MAKHVVLDDCRIQDVRLLTSNKTGNTFSTLKFISLEVGEVEVFIDVTRYEEYKQFEGKLGSLTVALSGRNGRPQLDFIGFKSKA